MINNRKAIISSLLLLFGGCGFGTAGLIGASGSSSGGPSNAQSLASSLLVRRSATSPAPILFVLADQEGDAADIDIGFRLAPEAAFQPITLAPGSAPLTNVPSDQAAYEVMWDFATDLGGSGFQDGIEIQLLVRGGIAPAVLTGVSMGNDAPELLQSEPLPVALAEYSGNTDVSFMVRDSAADRLRVKVEYNDDSAGGFPESAWQLARPAATPGAEAVPEFAIVDLQATAEGMIATFRWDTQFDLAGFDADVQVRFTAADDYSIGASVATAPFRVDNNAPPQTALDENAFLVGIKDRGCIPIPCLLFDQESDLLDVVVQWRAGGEAYPALPADAKEMRDLLRNPGRKSERRELHIGLQAPLSFGGRVGALPGLAANQIRLPELADTAAGLMAYGGGRELEFLRPPALEPVAWTLNSLSSPMDLLPSDDGRSILILDEGGAGWRVREFALASGAVVRTLAEGGGAPRALGLDPSGTRLFVGSSTGLFRFDRQLGTPLGIVPHAFTDGVRGVTGVGLDVAVATGDDKLVRFDFTSLQRSTLLIELNTPWGVIADPLAEGRLYLAERGTDRVSSVDLDDLQLRQLAAKVAPGDISALGTVAFPSPANLTLENDGARLLVVTGQGATSLRALDLRRPTDLDGAPNGLADPFITQVKQFSAQVAGVACGGDALRVVCVPAENRIELGGGVSQRYTIVDAPQSAGQPKPYAPETQVVTLREDLAPVPAPGTRWRVNVVAGLSSPSGRRTTFLWDTADLPDPQVVELRILPIDGDIGAPVASPPKALRSTLVASPVVSSAGERLVAAVDLDGDGDSDIVTNGALYLQTSPQVFAAEAAPGVGILAAVDLEADGDIDLVAADSLYIQQSPGVYATMAVPGGGTVVAAADLNGDALSDLVSASGGQLTVYLQSPAGTFVAAAGSLSASGAVTVADFNRDGNVDLLVGGAIFLQTGSGTFAANGTSLQVNEPIVAADLDGDGDIDIAGRGGNSNTIVTWLQTMPGTFELGQSTLSTGAYQFLDLAVADLDGDGDNDLLACGFRVNFVIGFLENYLTPFFQTKPGVFSAAGTPVLTDASFVSSVLVADMNGDGGADVVAHGSFLGGGGGTVTVHFETTRGDFVTSPTALPAPEARGVAVADLDGDGDMDLVAANRGSGNLTLFLQAAPGVFTPGALALSADNPGLVTAVDLDGDGDIDLVSTDTGDVADPGFGHTLFFQLTPGVFVVDPTRLDLARPGRAFAADFDGDGDVDLVSTGIDFGGQSGPIIRLFEQTLPGQFVVREDLPGGSNVILADVDGDGDIDILTGSILYVQDETGMFMTQATPGTGITAAADLDGDGDLDLVGSGTLFYQEAAGVYSSVASPAGSVSATADFDGDGDVDLLSGGVVYFQLSPRIFAAGAQSFGAVDYEVADLDGDGDLDLVSAGFSLTVLWGGR